VPLTYRPIRIGSDLEQQMEQAPDDKARIELLLGRLVALEDQLNVELRRVSNSINGAGGERASVRALTADAVLSSVDGTVFVDTTGGPVTLTLPFAREYVGMRVCVKRVAGTDNVTLAARSGDTVDGVASVTANGPVFYQSDGLTAWVLI
jgi:hypothetical protein